MVPRLFIIQKSLWKKLHFERHQSIFDTASLWPSLTFCEKPRWLVLVYGFIAAKHECIYDKVTPTSFSPNLHQIKRTINCLLKPLHTIGKVSVNASILYKNQEICNKTNLWKFQLISLFILRENSKNAFNIFVFILMAGVFVLRDENSLLDLISLIIRKR